MSALFRCLVFYGLLVASGSVLAIDSDGDGVDDSVDAFPLSAAASVDTDQDGQPSDWHPACNKPCQKRSGLVLDGDDDNDSVLDVDEISLGSNPLNGFDPPLIVPGAYYTAGLDDRDFGTPAANPATVTATVWHDIGTYFFSIPFSIRLTDVVATATSDVCGVSTQGVWCVWWALDTEVIDNALLQPLTVGGNTVTPVHDETGFLRYETSPGVWTNVLTDAFRVSSDHRTHTCVVSRAQGVYCWAADSLTDSIAAGIPAGLKNVSTVTDVAVGATHACAISNKVITCWGDTSSGKTTSPAVGQPQQVVAGLNHTCALGRNGKVSCWGDNSLNQQNDANADGFVDGITNVKRIAAGDQHACAIVGNYVAGGTSVVCWGDNSAGQTTVPTALTDGSTTPIDVRSAGSQTCAMTLGSNTAPAATICWPVGLLP